MGGAGRTAGPFPTLDVDGLLLDVDGVLTISWRPIPGAPDAVAELRREGIPFRLVTNTTLLSVRQLATELRSGGFEIEPDDILTAPAATAGYLREAHPGARCYLLGRPGSMEDMPGIEWAEDAADVVVVAGADDAFTWDRLTKALGLLLDGAALVAMHRSLTWVTAEGTKLDAGAYLLGLEAASGTKATVVGKPSAQFFRAGLRSLGLPAGRVAMVGDSVESDVLAAQEAGMRGVLVRTGAFRPADLEAAPGTPDLVVDSIADLPAALGAGL